MIDYFQFWWPKKGRKEFDSSPRVTARCARSISGRGFQNVLSFCLEVSYYIIGGVFTFISAPEVTAAQVFVTSGAGMKDEGRGDL
jgi:hypothetical protein